MRLDLYISKNKNTSRSRAANFIALEKVLVNGIVVKKPSYDVTDADRVEIVEDYGSSLGGIKLSHAKDFFQLDFHERICMDVGASNGGFTEVLLLGGAKKVYAIDVGECALPESLQKDDRVVVLDKTNARFLTQERFNEPPDFAVIDVSFISLTLILPAVYACIKDGGLIVALIKPQFECEKKDLTKKGILLDEKKRNKVIEKIKCFAYNIGLSVIGVTDCPHPFAEKNREYLIYMKK